MDEPLTDVTEELTRVYDMLTELAKDLLYTPAFSPAQWDTAKRDTVRQLLNIRDYMREHIAEK